MTKTLGIGMSAAIDSSRTTSTSLRSAIGSASRAPAVPRITEAPKRFAPAAAPSPTMPAMSATQSAGMGSRVSVTAMISQVAATTPTSVTRSRALLRRLAAAWAWKVPLAARRESTVATPKASSGTTITTRTPSHGRRSAVSPPITTRVSRMTMSTTTTAAADAVTIAIAKATIEPVAPSSVAGSCSARGVVSARLHSAET